MSCTKILIQFKWKNNGNNLKRKNNIILPETNGTNKQKQQCTTSCCGLLHVTCYMFNVQCLCFMFKWTADGPTNELASEVLEILFINLNKTSFMQTVIWKRKLTLQSCLFFATSWIQDSFLFSFAVCNNEIMAIIIASWAQTKACLDRVVACCCKLLKVSMVQINIVCNL